MVTMLGIIFFPGYGQTDTISEYSYGNMSAHKKYQLKAQNRELAVDRNMHHQMTGKHNDTGSNFDPRRTKDSEGRVRIEF